MKNLNKNSFLFQDISTLRGVGKTLEKYLKNKKISKVKDILLDLPYETIDRSTILLYLVGFLFVENYTF